MDFIEKEHLSSINRNSDQNTININQYAVFYGNICDYQLIFIDETGFNLHLTPKFGYSQMTLNVLLM